MDDKIYAVYFEDAIYSPFEPFKNKAIYTDKDVSNAVMTLGCIRVAKEMCDDKNWYGLSEEDQEKWIDKAKERFKIVEFVPKPKIW